MSPRKETRYEITAGGRVVQIFGSPRRPRQRRLGFAVGIARGPKFTTIYYVTRSGMGVEVTKGITVANRLFRDARAK